MNLMRWYILSLFFLGISLISAAQEIKTNRMVVNWEQPKKILTNTGEKLVLSFEGAIYSGSNNFMPTYKVTLENYFVSEFTLTNKLYEALDKTELSLISPLFLSTSPKISIDTAYKNKNPISQISILPFRTNPETGKVEKLVSLVYKAVCFKQKVESQIKSLAFSNGREESVVNHSVLATGDWYKIEIPNSGIYKIDYNFLSSLGINVGGIDPRKIKIFGNGGGMLPQANSAPRANDLTENAVFVNGEADGAFNANDYILFYGQGPTTWKYNPSEGIFNHNKNLYSDVACYFITVGNTEGKRIQNISNLPVSGNQITVFDEMVFHEKDEVNRLASGRKWYEKPFNPSRSFSMDITGIVGGSELKFTSAVMSFSPAQNEFNFSVLGKSIQQSLPAFGGLSDYRVAQESRIVTTIVVDNSINQSSIPINISFKNGASSGVGYLDFLAINYKKHLQLYGNLTAFRSIESRNYEASDFILGNRAPDAQIWDITNVLVPKNQEYSLSNGKITFTSKTKDTIREYIVFSGSGFPAPRPIGKIANQDLHGLETPDMVIVAYDPFISQAQKLADFRHKHDGLNVKVVSLSQVYNEFSSGVQDITAIRDFMKMFYDRSNSTESLKYLLLFGACSYDYKDRVSPNTNYVPVYETRNSVDPINSFSSDDYFGFLDSTEGEWSEDYSGVDHLLDIGIGRLPVRSPAEGEAVVNKLINYDDNIECYKKWRNNICFVADDNDVESSSVRSSHHADGEILAKILEHNYPVFNVNKLYLDAFPQISTPGGEVCPSIKQALLTNLKKGVLIFNYSGHGGEKGLAQEDIINIQDVINLDNYNTLPFFVTATCDFGRYDDPDPLKLSGGLMFVLNPKGGAVGGIVSTRPVYQSSNLALNTAFYNCVFKKLNGKYPRLGDIMRQTKNNSISGVNNRNYALLGDPSMKLAYPEDEIVVSKINESDVVSSKQDTMKALSKVTIGGEIRKDGLVNTNFNGSAHITVFDKIVKERTIGSKLIKHDLNGEFIYIPDSVSYKIRNNYIYDGESSVNNGIFSISFVVPKDISYTFGGGKISLYAKSNDKQDANGLYQEFVIGGSDNSAGEDNDPPQINAYLNDTTFISGGLTHPSPMLIVKLKDENGINIASTGIGHEITATLDNSKNVINLNPFYSAKKDTYKEGLINYPFNNLEPGPHTLRIKAWDTYNNSAELNIDFVVVSDSDFVLKDVFAFPNPLRNLTTFHLEHNKEGHDLEISVQLNSMAGNVVKELKAKYENSPSRIEDLVWDARDEKGASVPPGLYFYKMIVRSLTDGSVTSFIQKIIVLE